MKELSKVPNINMSTLYTSSVCVIIDASWMQHGLRSRVMTT